MSGTAEYIWFGTRAVRGEAAGKPTATNEQIETLDDNSDFATKTFANGDVVDQTSSEWIQLLAFKATQDEIDTFNANNTNAINLADGVDAPVSTDVNDTGDLRVGYGIEAENIADIGGGGRVLDTTGTLDESNDPIAISGLGKAGPGSIAVGNMDAVIPGTNVNRVIFSNDLGFGFLGGSGFETAANAIRINDGESVNFDIKLDKVLLEASFTVRVFAGGTTEVVIDSDGATIKDNNGALQGGFEQDGSVGELNLGFLNDGDEVRIDYVSEQIFVNGGLVFAGVDSDFFDAFEIADANALTLGSAVGNTIGWTADDLVLLTDLAPDNIPAADLPATCNDPDPTDALTASQNLTPFLIGDDVIVGGGGGNFILGLTGDDTIYGRNGDDAIGGGAGADEIYGQAGNDVLGGENITGNIAGGGDALFGGSGNDVIFGGDKGDIIVGGHGADTLYDGILGFGDNDADTFVYLDACDTNDVIVGFDQGEDLIDFSALYAGALDFDPDNGASFDAAYSVTFFDNGTDTTVLVELDGDITTAELALTLNGVYALTAADFVL